MKQFQYTTPCKFSIIACIVGVLMGASCLLAQPSPKKSSAIILNSKQKRYADTTIPEILKTPRYGRIMNLPQEFNLIEKQGLRPQVEEWFGILSGSIGENKDQTLINQNKRLLDIDKLLQKTTRFPISKDDALEYALKLTQKGYTPENSSNLLAQYNVNVIENIIKVTFPTTMILFSDFIVTGKADSLIYNNDAQKKYLLKIRVDKILKGHLDSKDIFITNPRIDFVWDGLQPIKLKEEYVFFLKRDQFINNSRAFTTEFPEYAINDPTLRIPYINMTEGNHIEQIKQLSQQLFEFFQSKK